ncbi:integral membrane protein, YjbE family [Clostridium acidisoli DSM 12555]|jgi:YjbE family integral membrane protein|uniref:Integral membrane protein, YjbE family n=1 Tax=Clostridium acidisoli DSM 12555 TaxID=1121291 RepID=A0A1W1XQB1_9CLOT|nr:TerC family protein [Clostridium acidisoli]SMC26057.1 integral membrane protein, YjbE family [Clostridium acidisoli DSM 12555]
MDTYFLIISGILKITMLDIVLSGDNIGIIALATKDLQPKLAKKASFIGVIVAITLRIIFTCLVTYILMIQWLPIKLVGGTILVIITWNLIKPTGDEKKLSTKSSSTKLSRAIYSIVLADLTMSLDNVLAIAGSAHGNLSLIVFGLLLNIPIIFWGSLYVAKIMRRFPFIVYVGAAVLAHTAFDMMLHDKLLINVLPTYIGEYLPYIAAILTLIYGVYMLLINNKNTKESMSK